MNVINTALALAFVACLSACSASQQAAIDAAIPIACKVGKSTLQKNGLTVAQCTALGGAAVAIAATVPAPTTTAAQ